jgi:diguanylate cyclase (GGDEF)-like protein
VFQSYRGSVQDVTDSYELSKQLAYQANHDALTGLVNRRKFELRVKRVLDAVHERGGEHALCYLDLDQFKVINDTCGHVAGDELLRQLATVLREQVPELDTVARLGGDEFGILMERCPLINARVLGDALRNAVANFRL